MLQVQLIGTLGADCELKTGDNSSKFTTFRAAHNDTWVDDAGTQHTSTIWVDCVLDDHPKVAEYLKRGQLVFVEGYCSLRVYSSPKDRCMKAGMTIRVRRIELLGAKPEPVPRELIDDAGAVHKINKFYHCDTLKSCSVIDKYSNQYTVDKQGWVTPVVVTPNTDNNGK